jgi:hypothetical protein
VAQVDDTDSFQRSGHLPFPPDAVLFTMILRGGREDAHFHEDPDPLAGFHDDRCLPIDYRRDRQGPPPLLFCTGLHNFPPAFQENI